MEQINVGGCGIEQEGLLRRIEQNETSCAKSPILVCACHKQYQMVGEATDVTSTEYVLHPLGRKLMIGLLVAIFVAVFATGQYWVAPLNAILGLVTSFRIGTGFFVRGAGAILLSIASISLLLEVVFDKIGWYRMELDGKRILTLEYRNSLREDYKKISFSLRETKVQYVDRLIWILSLSHERKLSIMLPSPDELPENPFYDLLDAQVDEYYYKVRNQLKEYELDDFPMHYIFKDGEIKAFPTEDFTLLTGISTIYPEAQQTLKEEDEDEDEELDIIHELVDPEEYKIILSNADIIHTIPTE